MFGATDELKPPAWIQEVVGNFEIVEDEVAVAGFQLYAVEKWVVQREKVVSTIAVYTGDEKDKIYVTVLRPASYLSEEETLEEFHRAVQKLRKDGARPKETAKGIVMTTFLPNFRPDLTIVQIPGGNYRAIQDRFYANIDLLRMGCTGRRAVSLDEPDDSTREKFVQVYHFPETIAQHTTSSRIGTASHSTHGHSASLQGSSAFLNPRGGTSPNQRSGKDSARSSHVEPAPTLQTTVLNLIKIVQSALSLFGLFDIAEEERDGLLCDTTVDGIRKCIDVIGKFVDVEPTERVLDPSVLAAILSVIISTRTKLHCLGIGHTKDPFLEPTAFVEALITFQRTQFKQHHHSSSTASTSSVQSPHHHKIKITPYLSAELIQRINSVYAAKIRAPEPYKVHRVIKHKIDDSIALASNLSESLTSNIRNPLGLAGVSDDRDGNTERPMHVPGLGTLETPVADLEILARMIIASGSTGKEGAGTVDSLRYVWTGKKNAGIREKERKERGKELIEVQKERARDRERTEAAKRRDTIDGKQMKSDGEEGGSGFGVPGLLWKGKLFGSSLVELGLNRPRKNTDVQSDPEAAASPEVASSKNLPSLMVTEASRLDLSQSLQDPLSQPSSIAPSPLLAPTTAPPSSKFVDSFPRGQILTGTERPATFAGAFDEQWPDRRFRRRRNLTGDYEDDLDAEDQWFLEEDLSHIYGGVDESASFKIPEVDWWVRKPPKKRRPGDLERRHSISHLSEYQGHHVLAQERMEADVDLCSAYFDLQAKEKDMERVAQLLQTLLDATRRTNDALKSKQLELALAYDQVDERSIQLSTTSRQTRSHIEELLMTGKRLNYRMSALDRSAGGLETTLRAQRLRTKDAMQITGAEGANDDLKWGPEELKER